MSAISLKSITGITSITTPAAPDNQITLHTLPNTVERVRITGAGKVGIGTTGSEYALSIREADNNNKFLMLQKNSGQELLQIREDGNNHIIFDGSHASGELHFYTAGSERLRITSGGAVGIGTNNPLSTMALDIVGSIRYSNQSRGASGSASEPSYAFYSDHDSGMYRSSTNQISFATAGTERLRIGSDGTLTKYLNGSTVQAAFGGTGQINGIASIPSMAGSPLVVGRDTGTTRSAHFAGHLQFDSGYGIQGNEFSVYGNGNGLYLNSNVSGDAIIFQTHNGSSVGERFRIYSDGDAKFSSKLGVGVEPVETFDVRTTGSAIALIGSTNASGAYLKLDGDSNGDGSGGDYARLVHDTDGRLYIDNLKSTADIVFRSTSAATERLRIDSSGNVGIDETGTILAKLHVVGGRASGTAYDAAVFAGGQNSTQNSGVKLYLSGCENDPTARGVILESIMSDNSNAHRFSVKVSASSAAPTERFRINHNGTVKLFGNQSNEPGGELGIRYDKTGTTTINIENLSTSSVNNQARLALRTNNGYAYFSYYNQGELYVSNPEANGYFVYYGNTGGGASQRLRINSNGRVSLSGNTTNNAPNVPDGNLHIQDSSAGTVTADADANELILESSGNTGMSILSPGSGESSIYFGNPGTNGQKDGWIKYYHETHSTTANRRALTFRTSGTERFRIDSNGRVGIKEASPYAELDIASSVEDSDTGILSEHGIRLSHVGAADEEVIPITAGFKSAQDRARAGIGFISKTISGSAGSGGAIGFYTRNSADGTALRRADERMRVHENGRVTIGDSDATPAGTYGLFHLYQASNDPYMIIQNGGAGDAGLDLGGISFRNNTNQQTLIKTYQANINTANLHFYTNYNGNLADRFLMESTGTFAIKGNVTDEKIVLSDTSNPYIRFREGSTNRAYVQWNSSDNALGLYNQEDGSVLRIKDGIDFSKDGSTFYNVHHSNNSSDWGENYTNYFVGTASASTSVRDTEKTRFYKVSIDTVRNYAGGNDVRIMRAGVHTDNSIHGMWVGSMDVQIKFRPSYCGNGSNYSRIVHNYHSNTSSVTQGQGGGNIAKIRDYIACGESSRLYVWLRGQLSYQITVNGRPATIYAIDMNDYVTSMDSSVMPSGYDAESRDALSIYFGYQGQSGAGRKLYGNAGGVEAQGNVSATGSKPFKIPHPLVGLSTTKNLVHAAIEGPQCDNIYRGKTTLVAGISTVNIDTNAGMTEGTFATLNRDVQCFTTNETGWTPIKGSVSGNQLTILAQDNSCTDTISWMVVGERQDYNIINNTMTDSEGHLIVEPDFEEIVEPENPGEFASGTSQIDENGVDRTFLEPLSS